MINDLRTIAGLLRGSHTQEYLGSTRLEQFVTRFLLKETGSQLQSLQSSLECAMEATAEQMCPER